MTLPAGKALGTTEDPKELIKGKPAQVDANATALSDEATRIQGLADDLDAISIEDWAGGHGKPAYDRALKIERAKWTAYVGLLDAASTTLSTYATALRNAQSKAQDAIDLWNEGEAATATAQTEYDNAVTAYNNAQSNPLALPQYGSGSTSVIPTYAPARPGPFVDPGEKLRKRAEQILSDARDALEAAGALALKELGGLDGAKTEGSSGPSVDGSVEGPSFNWDGWSKTFGMDPKKADPGHRERDTQPWTIDLGSVDGSVRAWGADGSIEDYWGDVKVHANGSITVLGAEGGATASINSDGLVIGAHGKVILVGAEGEAGGEWGYAEAKVHGEAYVGAEASGDVTIGKDGAHVEGEAFAGAKAEADISGDVGGVGGKGEVEGWAGVGVGGHLDAGLDDGKLTVGGSFGAALGLGGKVDVEITIDPGEVIDTGKDIIDGIGGLFH